jgi:gliding motility-associated-like protein
MNFSVKTILIAFLFFISAEAKSQIQNQAIGIDKCGFDLYTNKLRLDPSFAANEKRINALIKQRNQAKVDSSSAKRHPNNTGLSQTPFNPAAPDSIYSIPIVFHIVNNNPEAITNKMIANALNELNDAFAHRGSYGVDPLGVHTGIEFCLAKVAPDGGKSTGIDRIKSYYEDVDFDLDGRELNKLVQWDTTKYINVWLVNSVVGEQPGSTFECGGWVRYGIIGYASTGGGVVINSLDIPVMVHEIGHSLSLLHTFAGGCANNDCTSNGDLVCDTPPDAATRFVSCNSPDNSCNTDTASGSFYKDVPDIVTNFMDYGGSCPTVFTRGQADRMRAFAEILFGNKLFNNALCAAPCDSTTEAKFNWDNNPYPTKGDLVQFNNVSNGSSDFEWYVNGVMVSSSSNYSHVFADTGRYEVKLVAYSAGRTCSNTYIGYVIVNCGVDARFSPTERIIASKKDIYKDPAFFRNTSNGADDYKWYVIDNATNSETMVDTKKDLLYDFLTPGFYSIRLIASKGSCVDTSNAYTLRVVDPSPEGSVRILAVNCYNDDYIRIVFTVDNNGYDTIPKGTSIHFYDKLPGEVGSKQVDKTFLINYDILGNCQVEFTQIIKANRTKQDTISLVFDEENNVDESNELNNSSASSIFQYRISINPGDTTVYSNTNLQFNLINQHDASLNVKWTTPAQISCINCSNPIIKIKDTTLVKVDATSIYNCTGYAETLVNVMPIDISITKDKIFCYQTDSLLIESKVCLGNNYSELKKDIEVRYYDADTSFSTKKYLGSGYIDQTTVFDKGCVKTKHLIRRSTTGNVFMYLNNDQVQFELNLSNNSANISYLPIFIQVNPKVSNVYRGDPVQLTLTNTGEPYTSLKWIPDSILNCKDCPTPIATTNSSMLIRAYATTAYNCIDSAEAKINTFYKSHIAIPNVFTPDGDGLNDYFYIIGGTDVVTVKLLQVFNRWGERVFESKNTKANDYSTGWNGNFKGNKSPMGTYVYYTLVTTQSGKVESYKGTITLIR